MTELKMGIFENIKNVGFPYFLVVIYWIENFAGYRIIPDSLQDLAVLVVRNVYKKSKKLRDCSYFLFY